METRRPKWTQLDWVELRAIPNISAWDYCYYYLIRTSGGFGASVANSRIHDFKKPLDRFGNRPDVMRYKNREIDAFALDLSELLKEQLEQYVMSYDVALVPINTSRPWGDPFYDDRLVRLCEKASDITGNVRVANVMNSKAYIQASHEGGPRDYDTLMDNLEFLGFGNHIPNVAILVDDVLTKGTHYAVCKSAIRSRYPETLVMGAFLSLHRSDFIDYGSYGIEYQA